MPGVCLGQQQTMTQPQDQGPLCFAWFEATASPSMLCSRALGWGVPCGGVVGWWEGTAALQRGPSSAPSLICI